jgi:hypothetical protein
MADRELDIIQSWVEYLEGVVDSKLKPNKIPTTHTSKTPDFLITPVNYLVEIKEIHDRQEVKEQAAWGGTIRRLHEAIDRSDKKAQLTGGYIVSTPETFKLPQNVTHVTKVTETLLDAILASSVDEFNVTIDSTEFNVAKYTDTVKEISFSWIGTGRSINPAGTVYENIFRKLAIANRQLSYTPPKLTVEKRVLLLVNEYVFARQTDIVQGLSYSFEDLFALDSIDEIWVQFRSYQGTEITHSLVWSKSFGNEYRDRDISPENAPILEKWFYALDEMETQRDGLFKILKNLFAESKPYELINDRFVRERMIRLGEWLIENKRFEDAIWLIDAFIDDPNPSSEDPWDDGHNLDQEIEENKDSHTITTVLGHLAWVVQKLTTSREYLADSLKYSVILANNSSTYVKLQSLIPLIEITKRRGWLREIDNTENTNHYEVFKTTVFSLLNNYGQYKAFGNWMAHLFFYFQDLNSKEVLLVLDKLQKSEEGSALYVYFAIFRKRHHLETEYQSEEVEEALRNVLSTSDNPSLRGSIAWQLAKIIRESPKEFDAIRPWIDLMLERPYERNVYDDLEMAIEKSFEIEPGVAVVWFKRFIDAALAYAENAADMVVVHEGMWLSLDDPIDEFAKYDPSSFAEYLQKIFAIWKCGAFIGDPSKILVAYQHIENAKLRSEAKKQAKLIHKEIKGMNPKLSEVTWV